MWNRVLSIILVITITGALGALGYVIAAPKVGERFTEFYVLGLEGKAIDYPAELKLGEEARVMVGIVNHEREDMSYRLEVTVDGIGSSEIGPVVLGDGEKWEREAGFTPARLGDNQKVEFVLYRQGQSEAYRSVHLWVNVRE